MDTKELANRGKKAENKLRAFLEDYKLAHSWFDMARMYDARSAGGRFPSQVGDFLWFSVHGHGAVEVKQVHHDFRLPNKNFKPEQISKLVRREMAGSLVIIAVYHTSIDMWRLPTFDTFSKNRTATSWDLRGFPPLDFETVKLTLSTIWQSTSA